MIAPSSPPPGTRAGLAGADTWASITYDVDGPSLEFVRPPFNLDLPLTDAELAGMVDGVFPAHVEAAIAAATMPPSRPLTEADWATLSAIARAALQTPSQDAPQPDAAPGSPARPAGPADRREDPPPVAEIARHDAANSSPVPEGVRSAIASPELLPPTCDEGDRDFKVILEFAERGAGPRRVVISAGGAGRSELFRSCDVDDWRDALLTESPQVVEAFFARCRERPVYPAYHAAPASGAATEPQVGTRAPKDRPGRRGKGGGAAASPLLVFTPAPAASDPDATPSRGPLLSELEPATPGPVPDGTPPATDEPAKPMRQQLAFLFD